MQEAIRKMKLKVNGKDVELDEPEVIRRAQLASAADEKFREAAQTRRQMEEFMAELQSNPLAVLTHPELGINFRELAETYLAGEFQRELMDPKDRELQDLRSFKEKQEAQLQEAELMKQQQAQQAHMQQLQQKAAREYDQQITDVLRQSNLPKTPGTIKRVAEVMYNALEKGYEIDVNTAVDMVRESYSTDLQSLVGGMEGEGLVKFFGEELLKKIRKHDLAQLKARSQPQPAAEPQQRQPSAPRQQEESRGLKTQDWLAELRRKAGIE